MLTQDDRFIAVDTPLGKDVLLLTGFKGNEGLSRLFRFELNLLSENHNIKFKDIIGEGATVAIVLADGSRRFFNGIISRFVQGSGGGESGGDPRYSFYTATMVPWFWLLTRTADSRIFQELSVPDIVEKIFSEKGFSDYELELRGSYEKRDYCVQYRETDFNFVSRLLEDEGIYYFFKHENGKHTMVLADAPESHKPCPKQDTARYQISAGGWLEEDVITRLQVAQEIMPGKYTLNDYNFEIPSTDLKVEVPGTRTLGPGEREIYDYPGFYAKRTNGDRIANIRMQEQEAGITKIHGSSDCRAFTSGYRFDFVDYYREDMNNKSFVLTSIEHTAFEAGDYPGILPQEAESASQYINYFTCIPFEVPYRPSRDTIKPFVRGAQTAIVVGPAGEEIYTDQHGRVKVQFHWDREGRNDENSSCWMRVSQPWAGAGWGSISIPRIGQEVIVDFMEGEPDRPIITGRVYHGSNPPPYGLPAGGVVSGLKSNSTPGGGGYNEMSMDDTKGKEKITIHGQYDMESTIEHDQTLTVHNNRTSTIDVDDSETVGSNQTINIGADQKITVGANQNETIGSNQIVSVGANQNTTVGANQSVQVGSSKTETISVAKALSIGAVYQVSVGGAMNETVGAAKAEEVGAAKIVAVGAYSREDVGASKTVDAGGSISESAGKDVNIKSGQKMKLDSGADFSVKGGAKGNIDMASELVIQCGGAKITLKKSGDIKISGKKIELSASQEIKLSGMKITSEAKAKSLTKGAMVNIEASGINTIKGALVKVN
ncbi:MAG: type VI secretion system tip protein VgrG [Desulfobacterales bacterium]|nr:type VI secretion system tip protein VgrG [Desulfobacterales bacterium]